MSASLYLIPVTLGDTPFDQVLPSYNQKIIASIKHFIVENKKSAIRFLVRAVEGIDIDSLTFYELSEHTDSKTNIDYMLKPALNGEDTGIISEAGCPAIADPGSLAVELAHKKNIPVVPLVGPNSIILSLMSSGFNGQNFAFNGYLPVKPNERTSKLHQLENKVWKENQTQIFIETPYRNEQMISSILSACRPDTKLCIACGLTTAEQFISTQTVAQWKKTPLPPVKKIPAIFLLYK